MFKRRYSEFAFRALHAGGLAAALSLAQCPLRFAERDTGVQDDRDVPVDQGGFDAAAALDASSVDSTAVDGGEEHCDTPHAPCGAVIDCADYVRGLSAEADLSICSAYTGMIRGRCGDDHLCVQASSSDCMGLPQGLPIAYCSSSCVLPAHGCVTGAPVAGVTLRSVCALGVRTSSCTGPACVETSSISSATLLDMSCNNIGLCTGSKTDCNNLRCGPDKRSCLTECRTNDDCVLNVPCVDGFCSL
jgi:hypothetical protein